LERLQPTGATELVAQSLNAASYLPLWSLLALVINVSMLLALLALLPDLVHNTPTAVLMAPIA